MASARHIRALGIVRQIEVLERCPMMTSASIDLIERSLSDYAIACLSEVRQRMIAETLDAPSKHRILAHLATAIQEESQ